MHFSKLYWFRLFAAAFLLLPVSVAGAADAPGTRMEDPFKKRTGREQVFLLRRSEDLGRTLAFVNETTALLNEQAEAAANRDPDIKANERKGLLEWYQKYADWLRGMSAECDLDVSSFFSKQHAGAGWVTRYEELAKGSRKLADELGAMIQTLDGDKKKLEPRMRKLNTAVAERRILVDKDDLELAREIGPSYRDRSYDRREALYKDLTDEEVLYFRNELRSLGEQQKYFECLSELGKYEEVWLLVRSDEFTKSQEIAGVISGAGPGPLVHAVRDTIRTYEADRAALKRRSGEIDAKNRGITKTGSLRALDRLEELSRYYENMRNRFERHVEWLGAQIGSYQADLIELGKEL
ncbi:MAG: hypothetical protein AABZ15_03500 [Nitrospirota bacterium]